jgi:hypothetical protein
VFLHGEERRGISEAFIVRALIPFMRTLFSLPNYFPKLYLLIASSS